MVDATHKSFNASDRSYYAIIKKEAHNMAIAAGFTEKRIAELDIVIAEMTSNLYKYANDGELLIGYFGNGEYMEIISIDNGPGMSDISKMKTDGYSSTNTMGHGLGSIDRLSDKFDIYSNRGWGTIVLSRIYKEPQPHYQKPKKTVEIRPIIISKPMEVTSGDGLYYKVTDDRIKLMLCDGLGHGP